MKQNLVGKILGKIKIFGQDFVTIVKGMREIFCLHYCTVFYALFVSFRLHVLSTLPVFRIFPALPPKHRYEGDMSLLDAPDA